MTRAHRTLATLIALVIIGAIMAVTAPARPAPASRPAASPLAASSVDDARLVRLVELRANRAEHRRVLAAAHVRAVAAARARAAAEARQRAAAAAAAAARRVATSSVAGIPAVWMRVAGCEWNPAQKWATNTGNGFYGAFQIEDSNARFYGYARPDTLSPLQQLALARLILRDQGVRAWPVCGPRAGLQPGD